MTILSIYGLEPKDITESLEYYEVGKTIKHYGTDVLITDIKFDDFSHSETVYVVEGYYGGDCYTTIIMKPLHSISVINLVPKSQIDSVVTNAIEGFNETK